MKIIDFARKGNVVRFFLGEDDLERWWGDDWNDVPYEHNAGEVYNEYVSQYIDVAFPYDAVVVEPADGHLNSQWSKEDMIEKRVPCIVVLLPKDGFDPSDAWRYEDAFDSVTGHSLARRFYFGDQLDESALL